MSGLLHFAALCLAMGTAVRASCTPPSTVSLPITDVELSNGQTRRGIPLSVGTPKQDFSLVPSFYVNGTLLYNESTIYKYDGSTFDFTTWTICYTEDTPDECISIRGGQYNPDNSSTVTVWPDIGSAGGDVSDTLRVLGHSLWYYNAYTDVLTVNNITIDKYPFATVGLDLGQSTPQSQFGLGTNSTVLNALKNAGQISSRSFGFWWGRTGASSSAQMDGQIVFGGYDAAKVTGQNYTFEIQPWSASCLTGLWLNMTDISVVFPNGTSQSITSPVGLPACLALEQPDLMTLDYDPYFSNFEDITDTGNIGQSNGTNYGSALYPSDDVFQGQLSVSTQNGPSVTMPNELLVLPDTTFTAKGAISSDLSKSEVLIQVDGGHVELGRTFFQELYLFVNYDDNTFTVWAANATTDTNIVAVGGATNCSSAPSTSTSAACESDCDTSNGLSAGAIAGIAIGALAGLALLGLAAFLLLRRRRKSAQSGHYASPPDQTKTTVGDDYYSYKSPLAPSSPYLVEKVQPTELSSEVRPTELGESHERSELPA